MDVASIKQNYYKKLSSQKKWTKWTKNRLKTVIYMRRPLHKIFRSREVIHWTLRMIKKFLSLSKNLFPMTASLTFAFSQKRRVNKTTSCEKKTKKTDRKPILLFES